MVPVGKFFEVPKTGILETQTRFWDQKVPPFRNGGNSGQRGLWISQVKWLAFPIVEIYKLKRAYTYNLLVKQLSVMYLIRNFLQHPGNLIFLEKKTLIAENHQSFILAEVRGYGALNHMILKTRMTFCEFLYIP